MAKTKIFRPEGRYLVVTSGDLTDVLVGERLSVLSSKILCSAIATIKPKQSKFEPINFNVKDLATLLGVHKHNNFHSEIRKAGDQLLFYVGVVDEEKNITHSVPLVQDYRYERGQLRIEFNDAASSYLLDLTGDRKCIFSSYHLSDVNNLKKANMIRFFWYAIRKCRSHPRLIVMSVDEYFDFMQLSESHREFSHLNRRSLAPLLKELNQKTHLNIECVERRKTGHKITELVFKISYVLDKQADFTFSPGKNSTVPNLEAALNVLTKSLNISKSSAKYIVQRDVLIANKVDDSQLVGFVKANVEHVEKKFPSNNDDIKKKKILEALKENLANHSTERSLSPDEISEHIKEKEAYIERLKQREFADYVIEVFKEQPITMQSQLFDVYVELVNDGVLSVKIRHVLKSLDILLGSSEDKVHFSNFLEIELGDLVSGFKSTSNSLVYFAKKRGVDLKRLFQEIDALKVEKKKLISKVE